MKRLRIFWAVLVVLATALRSTLPVGAHQTPALTAHPDIYRNLVGLWEGDSTYRKNGDIRHDHITIAITEEVRKHRIRMEYVDHNDAGIDSRVRWLKLDPANGSMEMIDVDEHEVPDVFEVKGLREFAQTGIGEFTAVQPRRKTPQQFKLNLDSTRLIYSWAEMRDGKNYQIYSVFTFQRHR
jgi:hypothetical protein